jgi:hypothetical protein
LYINIGDEDPKEDKAQSGSYKKNISFDISSNDMNFNTSLFLNSKNNTKDIQPEDAKLQNIKYLGYG